jgi:outer membrane lipoprotein SlyB
MKTKTVFKSILVVLIGLVLTSCNKDLPPGEYDANEIGKIKKVIPGTIISKRPVNLHRQNTDTSAPRSKGSSESFIDGGYNQTHGVEYVIKLNSGSIISVVQSEDLKLKNKQKILVIYGRHTRVVADNGSDVY